MHPLRSVCRAVQSPCHGREGRVKHLSLIRRREAESIQQPKPLALVCQVRQASSDRVEPMKKLRRVSLQLVGTALNLKVASWRLISRKAHDRVAVGTCFRVAQKEVKERSDRSVNQTDCVRSAASEFDVVSLSRAAARLKLETTECRHSRDHSNQWRLCNECRSVWSGESEMAIIRVQRLAS